jgi:hypothetical protein
MGKKSEAKCKVCKKSPPCYEHCQVAVDGKHEADPTSATQADEAPFIVDFLCRHCQQGGSVKVEPGDIQWE